MKPYARAAKRLRRAVRQAIAWNEAAAFAGAGNPDHVEYIQYRAKRSLETLDRIIIEELENVERTANRHDH